MTSTMIVTVTPNPSIDRTVTLGTALSLVFCVVMAALAGPRVAPGGLAP